MQLFIETQRFNQWWLRILLLSSLLLVSGLLLVKGVQPADLVIMVIPSLLPIGFWLMQLDTRIDQSNIRYRVSRLTGWRTIPWSLVQKAEVCTHRHTSYGARWDFEVRYHVVEGQWGLRIDRINGGPIVIGTQQPDQLREFLRSFRPQNQE